MFKRFFNAPLSIGLSLSAIALSLVVPAPLNHKPPTATADYSIAFSQHRAMVINPTTQAVTLEAID